jgi:hypothetical protein
MSQGNAFNGNMCLGSDQPVLTINEMILLNQNVITKTMKTMSLENLRAGSRSVARPWFS